MSNLNLEEICKLEEILTSYFIALEKPGLYLKSLINTYQIQIDTATVDYNLPVEELVTNFYSLLLDNQVNLVSFLQVFQSKLKSDPDAKLTIEGYIKKLERSPIQKNPDYLQILDEERVQTYATSTLVKIDNNIIVNYDLDDLTSKFKNTLGYQGVFAFNVCGDYTILNNYIIKRILQELENKPLSRCYRKPIEIRLNNNESIELQIENYLNLEFNSINKMTITDLCVDISPLDVVLIIWNYTIEQQKLNSMIDNFLQEIKTKCHPCLENKSQCLIIIFANVYMEQSINGCIPLVVPQYFDIRDLCQWFRYHLKKSQIQEDMINRCLRQLENAPGKLLPTYHILQDIIYRLGRN